MVDAPSLSLLPVLPSPPGQLLSPPPGAVVSTAGAVVSAAGAADAIVIGIATMRPHPLKSCLALLPLIFLVDPGWGEHVTISGIHRYSKYLLTYSVPLQDYDTFHVILCVISPHHITELLVWLSYFYKEFPRNYSLEIWTLFDCHNLHWIATFSSIKLDHNYQRNSISTSINLQPNRQNNRGRPSFPPCLFNGSHCFWKITRFLCKIMSPSSFQANIFWSWSPKSICPKPTNSA